MSGLKTVLPRFVYKCICSPSVHAAAHKSLPVNRFSPIIINKFFCRRKMTLYEISEI